ncbi:YetF domain-containing protein [Vallitalea okinawensis]|uniref:YetF domain-containing protein n=1 Tax=Vallitalea okinawensis TaxID=2078660 RepID=UPI000CFCE554|nr:DUF421 domain-containing protein [Vallitalea okinawensis]
MSSYIEIIIQTALSFFSILFIARLIGRQQISQLTFHEYINGITFGSIAGNMATDLNNETMQHFAGLLLFGVLTYLISLIALKNRTFRKVVEGEPLLVIQDGKLLENNLKKARYSIDEFNMLLRQNDCYTPDDVEYGILESNGLLNIIKKADKQNVTLGDLNLTANEDTIPTELIIGGQIIYENLKKRRLSGKDLIKKLKQFSVKRIEEVMYATIDENGKMYVDKYEDDLETKVDFSEDSKGI